MNRIYKIFKLLGFILLTFLLVLFLAAVLFINLSPQFGGSHSEEQILAFETSGHYDSGKFHNPKPVKILDGFSDYWKFFSESLAGGDNRFPPVALPYQKYSAKEIDSNNDLTITWLGHSAFLMEYEDQHILIDPMLGDSPSPLPMLTGERFSDGIPISVDSLPVIDLVIYSHDHYDHLDFPTFQKIRDRVSHFLVPLGLGSHLLSWGIEESRITELNWHESFTWQDIDYTATPAQHFSGRGLSDQNSTFWASYVIQVGEDKIFFSGDGGYGEHFKMIGDTYGPFNLALIECGQYNKMWKDIHLMPEETVAAGMDLRSDLTIPIHWGAFQLALHAWDDPVKRFSSEAQKLGLNHYVPEIGERIHLNDSIIKKNTSSWWKNLK